jgi:Tol biopolymer transport system component
MALLSKGTISPLPMPAWSPLGNRIAFSAGGIWVMDADGTNVVKVTTGPLSCSSRPGPPTEPSSHM